MTSIKANNTKKISQCLWFDTKAEEAANFYVSIFKNSSIKCINRYPNVGQEIHGKPAGSVMTVEFQLEGQDFMGLNGGPHFKFNEAVSFVITCDTQEEVDYYWNHLKKGGDESAQQCGWLKDQYGLSWQVVPKILPELLCDSNAEKVKGVFEAMMDMKKLDVADLKKAYEHQGVSSE